MRDKVDPYLRPLYDALYDMLPGPQVSRSLESGEIEIAPLAFMRGRTLSNAFDSGRVAKCNADADENVPDPHGRKFAHGHYWRSQPD